MSFASKFNKSVNFDIDTNGFTYGKLADLYNPNEKAVYKIDGCYIQKGNLDVAPVFIVADKKMLVNIPSHLTETVREILNDEEAVDDIRNGKAGFTIYEYESHGKKCYSIRFVDIKA